MNRFLTGAFACFLFISCSSRTALVPPADADSLIRGYKPSASLTTLEGDLGFWQARALQQPGEIINRQKWAGALTERFHLLGNIDDLVRADSLLTGLHSFYERRDPGIMLALASIKMTRHDFPAAKRFIDSVRLLNAMPYAAAMADFDADFELGNSFRAAALLRSVAGKNDYGYNFRLSKLDHFRGDADSAITHMMRAAELGGSPFLKSVALSNAADLELHSGNPQKAAALYRESLRLNPSDFHSMSGLGRIALLHDGQPDVAVRLFRFVSEHHGSPESLWRLSGALEGSDSAASARYARAFADAASAPAYGNMYNKYLIDCYTGILKQPAQALALAQREQENRRTPQTAAWLAWTLVYSGKKDAGYSVFQKEVSGKPLETLELFWMGKMMLLLEKPFDARRFFEAAEPNRYDFSPKQQQELDGALK